MSIFVSPVDHNDEHDDDDSDDPCHHPRGDVDAVGRVRPDTVPGNTSKGEQLL